MFFLNYLQVQPLSALLLAENPGVLDQEPQLWGALPLLAPGAHVCLTPWPSAGAGAVQQPEPPAATPAPALPSPCPRKPPRRNSLRTTGARSAGCSAGKGQATPSPGCRWPRWAWRSVLPPPVVSFPPLCTAQMLSPSGGECPGPGHTLLGTLCAQRPVPCRGVSVPSLRAGHGAGGAGARGCGQIPQRCLSCGDGRLRAAPRPPQTSWPLQGAPHGHGRGCPAVRRP